MFEELKKTFAPPYNIRDLYSIFISLFIMLAIPLTVLQITSIRDNRSSASTETPGDFKVTINGKSVAAQKHAISPNPEKGMYYKDAYVWDMTFAPHETLRVHHDYSTGMTFNVLGQIWVNYVLRTGGLWQGGKIGHATIEVIPNTPTRLCQELGQATAAQTPSGMKIINPNSKTARQYAWDFSNFHPAEDLDFCLQTGRDFIRYGIVYVIIRDNQDQLNLSKMTLAQLSILRNSIFAQYGKKFNDPQLQTYFNKQWWYESNPNYADSLLTQEDKKAITIILKYEKK